MKIAELPDVMDEISQYALIEFKDLLDCIDEKYRVVLVLYYVEGLKIREIAELLEMKESTVKTHLRRGKNSLKREYEYVDSEEDGLKKE